MLARNRGVRHRQDLRRAPVIGFDLIHFRLRITLGKLQNVLKVRSAPRVDALRIVTHHHELWWRAASGSIRSLCNPLVSWYSSTSTN